MLHRIKLLTRVSRQLSETTQIMASSLRDHSSSDVELKEQLQSCRIEKQAIELQLIRKEAELASAQKIIRTMQQQVYMFRTDV